MSPAPAAADCEAISGGFWGQPVNSLSSLAFVLVGVVLLRRRPVLGWAGIAVGVGSFVFHGPMPGWAEWAHDSSLAVLAIAVAFEARRLVVVAASVVVAVLFGLWLSIAEAVTAILAIEVGVLVVARRERLRWGFAAASVGVLVAGAVIAALSRSDGALCDPDGLLQGHALWHLFGAGALWLWAKASSAANAGSIRVRSAIGTRP